MNQKRPIVSIDFLPDLSTMTDSTLESLCDQAFTQLEDGPVIEGLLAYYLSLQTELENRQCHVELEPDAPTRKAAPVPNQQSEPQSVSA